MRQLRTKRRVCVGAFVLVAAPVLLASVAYACTNLTNLQINPNSGPAGVSINVTGSNYRNDPAVSPGPVEIRLNSRSGPVVASLPVTSITSTPNGRQISMTVPIPGDAETGFHTLIATQHNTTTGALLSGFPVRGTYKVVAGGARESGSNAEVVDATAPAASADPATPVAAPASAAAAPAATSTRASAPATAASSPSVAASTSPSAGPAPADPVAGTPAAGSPAPAAATAEASAQLAATVTDTAALSASSATAPTTEMVSSGLMTAATDGSASMLPQVTLSVGAAIVLLSMLAFLKSGRSILVGRRLSPLA